MARKKPRQRNGKHGAKANRKPKKNRSREVCHVGGCLALTTFDCSECHQPACGRHREGHFCVECCEKGGSDDINEQEIDDLCDYCGLPDDECNCYEALFGAPQGCSLD